MSGGSPVRPGVDRDELEAERTFLLRSLDDLEAERAAGNVDDESYAVLRDDYTARAAAVIRSLADDEDERPESPPKMPWTRRLLVAAVVAVFIGVVGWWLAGALGERQGDELASGNVSTLDTKARAENFRAEIAKDPDNARLHLAFAQFLSKSDPSRALTEFGTAARLDPSDPEAPAYGGWLLFVSFGQPDPAILSEDKALERDPAYPDAKFFKGMVLLRGKHDPAAAIPLFQGFLASSPNHPLADQVRAVLAEAVAAEQQATTATTGASPGTSTTVAAGR